jgi:hypothetical protein
MIDNKIISKAIEIQLKNLENNKSIFENDEDYNYYKQGFEWFLTKSQHFGYSQQDFDNIEHALSNITDESDIIKFLYSKDFLGVFELLL